MFFSGLSTRRLVSAEEADSSATPEQWDAGVRVVLDSTSVVIGGEFLLLRRPHSPEYTTSGFLVQRHLDPVVELHDIGPR